VKSVEKYCPQRQTCSDYMETTPSMLLWNGFIKQVTSGLDFYGSNIIRTSLALRAVFLHSLQVVNHTY
jgi:hypothetical protein